MATKTKARVGTLRYSVSLPADAARRVLAVAKLRRTSTSRTLLDLVVRGLRAEEEDKARFEALIERFKAATDPEEQERLKQELARLTFGPST
jgi:hypothetical protein